MQKDFTKRVFLLSLFLLLTAYYRLLAFPATQVPGDLKDINATSKAWLSSNDYNITLYSIDNNISLKKNITVKSIYNKNDIALLATFSFQNNSKTKINKFYIQYPTNHSSNLPYVNGGDLNNSVNVVGVERNYQNFTKIDNNISYENNQTIFYSQNKTKIIKTIIFGYVSNGLEKYKLFTDNNQTLSIGSNKNKFFLIKNFDNNISNFYVSFGIYHKDANKSIKYISKWIKIDLQNNMQIPIDLNNNSNNLNLEDGKKIFIQNCIACHRYNANTTAPKNIAPMLTNIGGYANKKFLKESLLNPSKFINPKFQQAIKSGKIMSMPSFSWLSNKDFNNLLYFLESLKAN